MRIEIQVGGEEPTVHPIRENKIIVGSGEAANIQLSSASGVSRKHLEILVEGDKFFVKDMGSTNGTFINDERLIPGSKTPFTSFFPVMLGESVTISLLSDDEVSSRKVVEPTPTANKEAANTKADPNKTGTKTKNIANPKETSQGKPGPMTYKKAEPKKKGLSDNARMKMSGLVVALVVSLGVFYKFYLNPVEEAPVESVVADNSKAVTPVQSNEPTGPVLVADDKLPPMEEIQKAFVDFKCGTTVEKNICGILPETGNSRTGVLASIDHVLVLIPEQNWYNYVFMDKATHLYVNYGLTPQAKTSYLALLFFNDLKPFNWEEVDKNIFFVFYRMKEYDPYISSIVGVTAKEMHKLVKDFPKDFVSYDPATSRTTNTISQYSSFVKVFKATEEKDMPVPADPTKPLIPLPAAPPAVEAGTTGGAAAAVTPPPAI